MDFLHDILALPGSVGLGARQHNSHELTSSNDRVPDGHRGLFDSLRRLLRPSIDRLGSVYPQAHSSSGISPDIPKHDYRIQILKLKLAEVCLLWYHRAWSHC